MATVQNDTFLLDLKEQEWGCVTKYPRDYLEKVNSK